MGLVLLVRIIPALAYLYTLIPGLDKGTMLKLIFSISQIHIVIPCLFLHVFYALPATIVIIVILVVVSLSRSVTLIKLFSLLIPQVLHIGNFPPFLFLKRITTLDWLQFDTFAHIFGLLPAYERFPGFHLVLHGLTDKRAPRGPFNIDGIQISLVALVEGNPILVGVSLWTFQDIVGFNMRPMCIVRVLPFAYLAHVLLPHRQLSQEIGSMSVNECGGGHVSLCGVGVCPVVRELVIVHNKIIIMQVPNQ